MTNNFSLWNGTSIAHMFIRLMTKTNHPYNDSPLTLDEFNNDYNLLKDFITWHKNNNKKYLMYNFTSNNMDELISLVNYETKFEGNIKKLWLKMCNMEDNS